MKRLAFVFLVLLWALGHAAAQGIDPSWTGTGPIGGGGTSCPSFSISTDGCSGSPPTGPYTFRDPGFFPTLSGSTQNPGTAQLSGQTYATTGACASSPPPYVCHPPWAVPGVDYNVGPSCGACTGFGHPGSATDPTISANLPTGCTYASFKVSCSATADISLGPLDFTAAGNSTGTDITIGPGSTGACLIHDSIFNFDIAKTPLQGITVFSGSCAGGLTFANNSIKVHNSSTGTSGVFDNGGTTQIFFSSSQGTSATPTQMAVVTHFKYNYFQTCPGRCISLESGLLEYNYFGGLAMYTTNQPGIHGDGWYGTWDDIHCSCSNIISQTEQYDTWVIPPGSQGQTTCIPCGNVQAQDGNPTITFTVGQPSINVTTAASFGQVGDWVYTGNGTLQFGGSASGVSAIPPWPAPQITSCPGGNCATTGTFGINQPWVSNNSGSGGSAFYAPATMANQVIDHNVYITNLTQASYGSPNPGQVPMSRLTQGSNKQSNVTVTNNWFDSCGIGTGAASPPCGTPSSTFAPYILTNWPNAKLVVGNNVIMGNGNCLNFVTQLQPCGVIQTVFPPVVVFSPPSADTNVSLLGVTIEPNGSSIPSIRQGAKSTAVGGAVTLSSVPVVNNAIIAAFQVNNGSTSAPATVSCTDNATGGSNTYAQYVFNSSGSAQHLWSYIYVAPVTRTISSGFHVTCTATGATSQKTVVEESQNTNSGADLVDLYGSSAFVSPAGGANSASTVSWTRSQANDLVWGIYFGSASSMSYGTSPFAFTAGPAATQGSGVFTENSVQ